MTNSTLRPQDLGASAEATAPKTGRGTGRFSRFTYGTGQPKVANVLGASNQSVDWNNQTDEK